MLRRLTGHTATSRRGVVAVGLLAGAGFVLFTGPSGSAGTSLGGSYYVQASADGVRTTVASAGFLIVEQLVDAGAPSAQAHLDSIGNSTAYAAQPFPGALLLAAPAITGLSDKGVGYPLIASSSYPDRPTAKVDEPGYRLTAGSTPDASTADAVTGSAGDQQTGGRTETSASAVQNPTTGVLTATGESTSQALTFGGVLTIGRVHSLARVSVALGGVPQLSSQLEFAQVSVAGVDAEFTDKGLVVAGTTTPIGDTPLGGVLSQAGVSVHYLAPIVDKDRHGVVSAGLQITVTHDVTGTGDSSVTYTIGRTSARATGSLTSADRAAAGSLVGARSGGAGTGGGVAIRPVPPASSGSGALVPGASSAPVVAKGPGGTTRTSMVGTAVARPGFRTGGVYLALVVGAVAALVSAQLIRVLGVRLIWIPKGGI